KDEVSRGGSHLNAHRTAMIARQYIAPDVEQEAFCLVDRTRGVRIFTGKLLPSGVAAFRDDKRKMRHRTLLPPPAAGCPVPAEAGISMRSKVGLQLAVSPSFE